MCHFVFFNVNDSRIVPGLWSVASSVQNYTISKLNTAVFTDRILGR
jgi:hypothetical protein